MFVKLLNLYTSLTALYAKFPNVRCDAVAFYHVIEGIVIEKAWNISSAQAALAAAQSLVNDFAVSWDGGADALAVFESSVVAVFN